MFQRGVDARFGSNRYDQKHVSGSGQVRVPVPMIAAAEAGDRWQNSVAGEPCRLENVAGSLQRHAFDDEFKAVSGVHELTPYPETNRPSQR